MDFQFLAGADNPNGSCYELFFSPVAGTPLATDIRVWAFTIESGTWQSVDDDGPYPDRLPRVRLWTDGSRHLFGLVRISCLQRRLQRREIQRLCVPLRQEPLGLRRRSHVLLQLDWDYINQPDSTVN